MKSVSVKSTVSTVLGVVLIGTGVCFLNLSNLGLDPYSAMNYGVCGVVGVSFGTWQMVLNLVLFVPMLFVGRKYVGLGSLVNMVGVGYVAQFAEYLLRTFVGVGDVHVVVRVAFLILGVCLVCFGCAMYTLSNLGISPYDSLAYILEERLHGRLAFRWLRVITDTVCVAVAFVSGGTLGVSTVVMMFFTGPLVQFFKDVLNPVFDDHRSHKDGSKLATE